MSSPTPTEFWSLHARESAALEVYLLGCVDYDAAMFLQERMVREISSRSDRMGALLVCEHPPLVTIGREGSRAHLLAEPRAYEARQIEIRWVNRGGGCLIHSPGQLAVYTIVPLDRLHLGLAEFRTHITNAVVDLCGDYQIDAATTSSPVGVTSRLGQLAWTGIAAKRWTTYHGLFVNVAPDPYLNRLVRSCPSQRVTSIASQATRQVAMHSVRANLVHHLAQRLGYDEHHIYAGHPLLRRTRRKVGVHA